jgi:hypothetical protein
MPCVQNQRSMGFAAIHLASALPSAAEVAQNTRTIHVFVVALLVYVIIAALNALAMAALARRAELAIFRLGGVTRGQPLRMVRTEQGRLSGSAGTDLTESSDTSIFWFEVDVGGKRNHVGITWVS